jgi:mevalonate kinase
MKLKLVAAISVLAAIPALAHAQQGGPQPKVPKPTKAEVQNVVQIVTTDKAKTQAYCDLTKLYDQVEAAQQKNDTKTVETLGKQADALIDKLGPEYSKLIDGLEQVDPKSNEAKEFMSILSALDKKCTE